MRIEMSAKQSPSHTTFYEPRSRVGLAYRSHLPQIDETIGRRKPGLSPAVGSFRAEYVHGA